MNYLQWIYQEWYFCICNHTSCHLSYHDSSLFQGSHRYPIKQSKRSLEVDRHLRLYSELWCGCHYCCAVAAAAHNPALDHELYCSIDMLSILDESFSYFLLRLHQFDNGTSLVDLATLRLQLVSEWSGLGQCHSRR